MPQAYFFLIGAETPRNAAREIGAENAEVFRGEKTEGWEDFPLSFSALIKKNKTEIAQGLKYCG